MESLGSGDRNFVDLLPTYTPCPYCLVTVGSSLHLIVLAMLISLLFEEEGEIEKEE